MIVYAIRKMWHKIHPGIPREPWSRQYSPALFLACFAAVGFGKERLVEKMSRLAPDIATLPDRAGASRLMVVTAALEIWRDSPWFGVGGWGFRYLASSHLPERAVEKTAGLANVHNDPVQFLLEFGLVGSGLMAFDCFGAGSARCFKVVSRATGASLCDGRRHDSSASQYDRFAV